MAFASTRTDSSGAEAEIRSRGIRFLIVVCALAFPVTFWLLINPATARAAWAEFARIMPFNGQAAAAGPGEISDAALAGLPPQQQAEVLLQAAVEHSAKATEQIKTRIPNWRGRLAPTSRLAVLVNTALNSRALPVRSVGLEVELAMNNLAENPASANRVMARIESEPAARPWGLWMLGALGNRGVEPGRILSVLTNYSRNSDETTRFWAVEGLSLMGNDESIAPLLSALRSDSSGAVRGRAASALARAGMLTKRQRLTAVPALIDDAGDPSLEANTHTLAYGALHDITGANVHNTPSAWRKYWADNSSR